MPTITFERLTDDKRELIESSAIKEFSTCTYDQVSINRIIQDINMPRGSFYLYFENKEDLYLYIMKKKIDSSINILSNLIISCNGDVIKAYKLSLEKIIEYCNSGERSMLLKNFLLGLTRKIELKVSDCNNKKEVIDKIFNVIDKKFLKDEYCEDLFAIVDLLTNTLIHSLTGYLVMELPVEKIKKKYYLQLKIISEGIYKEEKQHD